MAVEARDGHPADDRPGAPDAAQPPQDRPRRRVARGLLVAGVVLVLVVVAGLAGGGWYYSTQLLTWPDVAAPTVDGQVAEITARGIDARPLAVDGPLGTYRGVLVPGDADTWVLVVHGRGGAPVIGGALTRTLADGGRPVLYTSYRNDGLAPADPDGATTFGDREWRDLQAWVDAARARGARRVVLYGWSMGGSVVASFLASSPDADLVDAVVLDSPVLSMQDTLELQAGAFGVPEPLVPSLLAATKAVATVRAGMDFAALEHVATWDADPPVLLVHGTADATVPDDPTVELADRLGDAATFVHPAGVDHVGWVDDSPAAYRRTLGRFLDREVPAG